MTTILLVEDNEFNRDALSRRLRRRGYDVLIAVDGNGGLELANTARPDIILLDMRLPVIDGWQVARWLKARPATRSIPVIALTAHALAEDRDRALKAGCDDYDTKPVDLPRLLAKMEALLGTPPPTAKRPAAARPATTPWDVAASPDRLTAAPPADVPAMPPTMSPADVPATPLAVSPADGAAGPELTPHLRHELRTPINHIVSYAELVRESAHELGWDDLVARLGLIDAAGQRLLAVVNRIPDPGAGVARSAEIDAATREIRELAARVAADARMLQADAAHRGNASIVIDLQRIESAVGDLVSLVDRAFGRPATEAARVEGAAAPALLERAARSDGPDARPSTVADPTRGPLDAAPRSPTGRWRGSLLVVDDNEANRDVLRRHLERQGHAVTAAEDGPRALAMLRAASFDLVLLDIIMPGMDGYEVLERMKADPVLREVPVIVLSALDELSGSVRAIEMGAEDFLPKPFDRVLLRARIGACLEKKRLRDQEVEYLRQVARVTSAAAAIEGGTFEADSLDGLAERPDELGQLARVFQRMGREVAARERRLQQQVRELSIEIDESRKARQVAEITETDYFQDLQRRARELRARGGRTR